jgi:hypothetical protein
MATDIYKVEYVKTVDGIEIEIIPLVIKYMRQAMDLFSNIGKDSTEEEVLDILCDCVRLTMKQYYPPLSNTLEDVLDNFDLNTIYNILDYSMGIKLNKKEDSTIKEKATSSKEDSSWDTLDLVKLETEIFLLGIWKNYDELEKSMSMPELITTISSRRELDYQEKKFLAAMQGINLDEETGQSKGQKEWEDMKARVFSGGATSDSKDILALQGQNAAKAGFGIGMGLDYEDMRDPTVML